MTDSVESQNTHVSKVMNRKRRINCQDYNLRARAAFERSKKEVGLHELRFHDLRHIAISRLWMEGYSALEISAASGHSDLKMLMRYSHYSPQSRNRKELVTSAAVSIATKNNAPTAPHCTQPISGANP